MPFFCSVKLYSFVIVLHNFRIVSNFLKMKIIEISLKVGIVDTVFITDVCTLKFKYFLK